MDYATCSRQPDCPACHGDCIELVRCPVCYGEGCGACYNGTVAEKCPACHGTGKLDAAPAH